MTELPVERTDPVRPQPERSEGPGAKLDWVDNHCHPGVGARGGPPEPIQVVLDDARAHGVVAMITVGTDAASSELCLEQADRHVGLWATAGVHPHDATEGTTRLRGVVDSALGGGSLVAIGECGLDYHYEHSPREVQRAVFAEQVEIARTVDLPLVIHTREAWEDTFAVLDDVGMPRRCVFHCFTGGPTEVANCLERGALISVSGIVTFPSATDLRAAVASAPLDRLMVETDSPYLAPVPHRGRPNRPAFVGLIGAEVARLHGLDVAEVAEATTATAVEFYALDLDRADRPQR